MSYLVLARKYRPKTFDEVRGQDVVTSTLTGAIQEDRVAHAYLLCGPRGTGKTTLARILAKALNCEKGPTPTPCGVCERCEAADRGADADVIEIDAASNNGVDEVRALREQAAYNPMRARYKVYLIDEVHMLSKAAFNALLKTLEEPPPHVKFLLATTERNKIPDTILSRCQVLQLDALPEGVIRDHLDEVFRAEEVQAADGVTSGIARMARGGMRDALSIADRLISLAGKEIAMEQLDRLSAMRGGDVLAVLEHTAGGAGPALLAALPRVEGSEGELTDELLACVRSALLLAHCGPTTPLVDAGEETRERLVELGTGLGPARAEVWLEELLLCRERIHTLPVHGRAMLESTLLALARGEDTLPLGELVDRLTALEARLGAQAEALDSTAPDPTEPPAAAKEEPSAAVKKEPSAAVKKEPSAAAKKEPSAAAKKEPSAAAQTRPSAAGKKEAASSAPAPAPEADSRSAVASESAPAEDADTVVLEPQAPPVAAGGGRAGGGRKRTEADRRAARSSSSDAWTAFLEEIKVTGPALGEVMQSKTRLIALEEGRAVIRASKLFDDEKALLGDARNLRTLSKAFSTVLGRELELEIEDSDELRPGAEDPYTQQVAELFDGRIED